MYFGAVAISFWKSRSSISQTFFLSLSLSIKTLSKNKGQNKIYSKISISDLIFSNKDDEALMIIVLSGSRIPITYVIIYKRLLFISK